MVQRFHHYEMGDLIGRGAMGSVYRGRNVNLDSPVAIKVLHPALTFDQDFLARFEREARTAAAIQSPNIVSVMDFGSENDIYFIIMELVDGVDMARVFSDLAEASGGPVPLPPEICLLILEEVAYGLRAAHEKGIWHRDVKPSNILLDRHGNVRVADFGLARDSNRPQDLEITRTGVILGTPSYMSPEQAVGDKLDGRTDVFSLGVVAYQWLSGNRPFSGESLSEIQQKIIEAEPAPLATSQMPWITPQIKALLDGSLHKVRSKRFQTMDGFLAAVRSGMESLDPGGSVAINRREHLRRFAQDPVTAAAQLRHESVQTHLRRGLRLKDMGLDKLEDALHEFRYVRALDPANQKANEALRELERRREDSGRTQPGFHDRTEVLTRTETALSSREDVQSRRNQSRRGLWSGLVIVVAIVAFLVVRGLVTPRYPPPITRVDSAPVSAQSASTTSDGEPDDRDSQTSASPPAVSAPATPETNGTSSGATPEPDPAIKGAAPSTTSDKAAESHPSLPPSQVKPNQQVPSPAATAAPRVTWSIPENAAVLLDGAEVWRGSGKGGWNLDPDQVYELVVSDEASFARTSMSIGPLKPGQTHPIGPIALSRGRLRIFGKDGMTVQIDGRNVAAPGGSCEVFRIGAGVHVLSVCLPGRAVKNVTIGSGSASAILDVLDSTPDCAQYKFTIAPDLLHEIAITFHKAGG